MDSPRNKTIEGLRGFSALLVLLYHAYNMSVSGGFFRPIVTPWLANGIAKLGLFGVMLFFCISGFLIVKSLVSHADVALFLKNRVIRIYPVFLVLHLAIFALGPVVGYGWMASLRHAPASYALHFASNLLFLPGLLDLPLAQKNAWSLSYEAAFYLVASLFYLAGSLNPTHWVATAVLFTAAVAGSAATILLRPDAAFFLVGVLAYGTASTAGPWLARRFRHTITGLLWVSLSFACFRVFPLASMLLAFAFFTTVVHEVGGLSTLLRTRPFQHLGRISYSLYLIHPFVFDPLRSVLKHVHHGASGWWLLTFAVLGATLSVLAAGISFRYLEQAGGRWLHRLLLAGPRRDDPSPPGQAPDDAATSTIEPLAERRLAA